MRILAFSDLHRDLEQAARLTELSADADVVIGAGDFASVHQGLEETIDAAWIHSAVSKPTKVAPTMQSVSVSMTSLEVPSTSLP